MSVEKILGKIRSRLEALNSGTIAFSFDHYPFEYVGEQIRKEIYSYDPKEVVPQIDLLLNITTEVERKLQRDIEVLPNAVELDMLPEPFDKYRSDFVNRLEAEVKYYIDFLSDVKSRIGRSISNKTPVGRVPAAPRINLQSHSSRNSLELSNKLSKRGESEINQLEKQRLISGKDAQFLCQLLKGYTASGTINWNGEKNLLHYFLDGLKSKLKYYNRNGYWAMCAEIFTIKGRPVTGRTLSTSHKINNRKKEEEIENILNSL